MTREFRCDEGWPDFWCSGSHAAWRDWSNYGRLLLATPDEVGLSAVKGRWGTGSCFEALTRDTWCSANLPDGWAWVGTYYAVTGYDGNYRTTDRTVYTCPHCAMQAARAQAGDHDEPHVRLSSYFPDDWLLSGPETLDDPEDTYDGEHSFETVAQEVTIPDTAFTFLDKIGVEIEGRWNDLSEVQDRAEDAGLSGTTDGSLNDGGGAEPYEFRTEPGGLTYVLNQVLEFYPDETGRDAGMHVHASFRDPTHVTLLATPEFYAYFRARWEAWGVRERLHPDSEFFLRLRGSNHFCRPNEARHDEDGPTYGPRYLQLNFSAWGAHKTVECRLLPMFRRPALAVSAIQELVTIYEDWIGRDCPEALLADIQHEADIKPLFEVDAVLDLGSDPINLEEYGLCA